jgi:hypothetical protein
MAVRAAGNSLSGLTMHVRLSLLYPLTKIPKQTIQKADTIMSPSGNRPPSELMTNIFKSNFNEFKPKLSSPQTISCDISMQKVAIKLLLLGYLSVRRTYTSIIYLNY